MNILHVLPLICQFICIVIGGKFRTLEIRMPNVSPKEDESYLCTYKKLPSSISYAVEFKALAEQGVAHHMLVIACRKPRFFKRLWDCSEESACEDEEKIIFAWAKNAPPFVLPDDVGFELGSDYSKYLVIQIHYARPLTINEKDQSGVQIKLSYQRQKYLAGIYLFESSNFEIPPHSIGYHVDMHCHYEDHSIAPFAFRTHAHARGRVLSAYRIRDGRWHLIGKGNPQEPQAFFSITNHKKSIIHSGDHLVARCTYDSNLTNVIYPGAYSTDEMCNFYMMYYTKPKYSNYIPSGCQRKTRRLHFPPSADEVIYNFNQSKKVVAVTQKPSPTTMNLTTKEILQTTVTVPKAAIGPFPTVSRSWHVQKKKLGQVSGLSFADNDNTIVIFHRGNHVWDSSTFDYENMYLGEEPIKTDTILKVDVVTGKVKKAFGKNLFFMPHGLTIDTRGNIWLTDVAMHQVFKFSGTDFKPLLTLGQKFHPGTEGYHFCKPADVAVSKNGYFYVADGYCNNRIVKFSAKGKLISEWGKPVKEMNARSGELNLPHSLSLDDDNNLLYVADRENGRIQVFTTDGVFKQIIKHDAFGSQLFAITFNKAYGGVLYAVNGKNDDKGASGFTISLRNGEILNTWKLPEKLSSPHDIAVSTNNEQLFVAETELNKVSKFSVTNATPKKTFTFPWKKITSSLSTKKINNTQYDNVKNIAPVGEKNKDEETLLPAIIVVIVLAFPLLLIIIGMIVQHMHFQQKRNKAVRNLRTNPMHSRKNYRCFSCCMTSEYRYDGNGGDQAFDKLIKGEIVIDEEDDEIFTRKA